MFYLDGISAEEIGFMAEEENFLSRASINYEEIKIDGKHGSEFVEKNYENVSNTLRAFVKDKSKLDYVKQMLTGVRILTFQGRKTKIRFYDINEVSRLGTIQELNVKYIRDPFWYKENDEYLACTTSVTNEGNEIAQPIIKLVGTVNTSVDITVNDVRFIYNFDEDAEVEIDCKKQTELFEGISKSLNIEIGFRYPSLVPGENTITVHSGLAEIYIKQKDVWL